MQRIKLYSLILVAIIWFMVIIPYFLLQTSFGANIIARYILDNSTYNVTIGNISHSFANPYEIKLQDVIVTDKTTDTQYLQAETLTFAVNSDHPFTFNDLNYIIIQQGHLNLANLPKTEEIMRAKLLQLLNISIDIAAEKQITIHNVKGGIQPWSTQTLSDKTNAFQFNFTAETLQYDDIEIQSVLLSGFQKNNTLFLNNVGGNINNGFFISKAKRLPDDSWIVDELQINHLNLQTEQPLKDLQKIVPSLPTLTINYFALTDSSLITPELKVEKSNLELTNLHYDKQWDMKNMTILFNADHIVWQDEVLTQPTIEISINNNQFTIKKAVGVWQDGMINASGVWANNHLNLNNVLISGIRYTLPENWLQVLKTERLPDYLSDISIKKLTVMPSNIIDIRADFPMQYTFFEARGAQLQLAKQHQLGLWRGNLTLKAGHATVNTMTLRHADLHLNITNIAGSNNPALLLDLSALTDTGLLEATAQFNQQEQRVNDLNITGYSVDPTLLTLWKILDTPIADNSFAVQLAGQFCPLQLNGQITLKRFTSDLTYPVQNNNIILN